jgi:ribose transport system substrate-binding protein
MKPIFCVMCAALAIVPAGLASEQGDKITVAYVTNGIDPFWTIAEKGAKDAAADPKINVTVEVRMPPKGVEDQKRMVQELLAKGVKGIAISPIDADNQGNLMEEIAGRTNLITHDSDAPKSKRLCYIGIDNYQAGRACGKLVKQALPSGGNLMIFVGRLGQDNAKLRRQGLIDELLDRSSDPSRYDEPGQVLKGGKFVILDTRTDGFDRAKAKQLAQDAITRYPNLNCMVGLFAYNPPICLDAVRDAGKLGKIKIVAFDENDKTLKGIKDGHVSGTVVQNPYMYGFESVRILAALARGDKSVLPKDGFHNVPGRTITSSNVDEFWETLKKQTGKN